MTRADDKRIVDNLVNVHIDYGLTYTHTFADGQTILKIDPYVDTMLFFPRCVMIFSV